MTSHAHQHAHQHADQHADQPEHDVVVVGGGAAGLSGAIALARSRRRVLVLDAGEPRNAPAAGVHNYLGHDGIDPRELLRRGRAEAESYGVELRAGRVVDVRRTSDPEEALAFAVRTEDGAEVTARRLLVATGLVDELPDLPGLAQHWGSQVLHCPYCHGWEVRDQAIAVLGTGPMAAHQALLFSQLSDDVVLVLPEGPDGVEVDAEALGRLEVLGVRVLRDAPVSVESDGDRLVGVRLASGTLLERDAVVVAPRLRARADFLAGLGLAAEDLLMGEHAIGSRLPAEAAGTTTVPGVLVAGNVTDLTAQVGASAAAGVMAGALLNAHLIEEDADAAVRERQAVRESFFERPAWEERYAGRDSVWSGRVNAQLATEAATLAPGRALDVGSGEGADAIWLAEQGWEVTGLEFSEVARERAAAHAARAGVGERTTWLDADLRGWEAGDQEWDLVTAHYFHQPDGGMPDVVRRLAGAVAVGGTLLVVGHHPADLASGLRHGPVDWLYTPEDLLPGLEAAEGTWELVVVESRHREQAAPDGGGTVTVTDAVLRARRTG